MFLEPLSSVRMNLELARLSLESGDVARWGAVARDLGRHLAAQIDRSKEWLLPFRRLAAGLTPRRTNEYERGFLEALELVATGFERQLDDAAADETEIVQLRSHPRWVAVLRQIDEGTTRPIDLARRLGVHPSMVTKLIDELEDVQLVTQTTQGKERPCRLTPRARVLLRRLPPPEETSADVARVVADVVPAVVACMTALVRDRRVGRERFLESMRGAHVANPVGVLALLDTSLRETACAALDDDGAWVATDAELLSRLRQHLVLACRGQPGTLLEELAKLSERSEVLLRVGNGVSTWDSAMGSLGRVRVIREDELRYGIPPPSGDFQIVYESPSLLAADRRHALADDRRDVWYRWVAQAIAGAIGRHCLSVGHGPPIRDFNTIEVPVPEYAV